MVLGSGDTITADQLPKEIAGEAGEDSHGNASYLIPQTGFSLTALEKQLVEQALGLTSGNQVRAARLLGISRDALSNRMKKHGLL